jgi:hypothetical protein
VTGAGRYKIQIATDFDFVDIVEQKIVGAVTTTVASELSNGTYYWRVAAGNYVSGSWNYHEWSGDWSFTVDTLGTPTPTNPTGGETVPDDTPRFN